MTPTHPSGSLEEAASLRVNAVVPGPVCTPLNPADHDVDGVSKFGSETPMKPPAQPEEIAPAFVVFLRRPVARAASPGRSSIIGGYTGGS